MKYRILLSLLFVSVSVTAQNSILFELSKPGVKHKSYLFGTMHVQHEKAFNFNDSVFWAIDQCKKAAFELDFNLDVFANLRNNAGSMVDSTFLINLTEYLKNDFIPKLIKEIPANELAAIVKNKLIPLITEYINQHKSENKRMTVVDQFLQNYADKNKLEIIGLETGEEQLQAIMGDFFKMDFKNSQFTEKFIDFLKSEKSFNSFDNLNLKKESMIEMYSKGDMKSLCEYIVDISNTEDEFSRGMLKRVFWDRNQIMFDRSVEQTKTGPIFIAVGAGHLCGENGLLELYRKAGYNVRAMNSHVKTKNPIQWKKFETESYSVEIPQSIQPDTILNYIYDETEIETASEHFNNTLYTTKGEASFTIKKIIKTDEVYLEEFYDENDDEIEIEEYYDDEVVDEGYYNEETSNDIDFYPPDSDLDATRMPGDTIYEESTPNINPGKKKSPFGGEFTEDELNYFNELKDSLTPVFMNLSMSLISITSPIDKDSVIHHVVSKKKTMELNYTSGLTKNTLKTVIKVNDDISYELIITGDHEILMSEDIRRFFTTFQVKGKK